MQAGAQSYLKGHKAGDAISIQPSTLYSSNKRPAVLQKLEKQGLDLSAHYTFQLDRIDQMHKADLNESLFQKMYGNEAPANKAEFLEKSKQHLQAQYEIESRRFLYMQIKNRTIQDFGPPLPRDLSQKAFSAQYS